MNKIIKGCKFLILPALGIFFNGQTLSADNTVSIEGSSLSVIELGKDINAGLDNIFVVYDIKGCSILYKGSDSMSASVYRYSNLGGGFREEIFNVDRTSNSISIPNPSGDMGYMIESGNKKYYFWVVDYIKHKFAIDSFTPNPEVNCDYSVIDFAGEASEIRYYSINGNPVTVNREIYVDYMTQEFSEDQSAFVNTDVRKVFSSLSAKVSLSPPAYCSSYFTVEGDRFLRQWGMAVSKETNVVAPVAVDCKTEAIQQRNDSEEGSNVIKGDDSGLGGSAPADISFRAFTTEGVIDNEWQMSRDINFNNPEYRFKVKDLDYTFDQEGTYYLRFIGSNYDGTCETYSDVYTVAIGASELICPNAFSPNGDGVNDIWKVSYRSLTDFHCEIFNRNGQKIFSFDNPDQGWDGTWHGKKVKSGVYYYVIVATGADGKKYKKGGDINIINFKPGYGTGMGNQGNYETEP